MKFLRDIKTRVKSSKWFIKLKQVKNLEIIIAVTLAVIALVAYFVISVRGGDDKKTMQTAEMTQAEQRVSRMISEIAGVGKARVLITSGSDEEVIGVVVVAEGADNMDNRIKMIRCVEKATGATVDQIEIFEMAKGG